MERFYDIMYKIVIVLGITFGVAIWAWLLIGLLFGIFATLASFMMGNPIGLGEALNIYFK